MAPSAGTENSGVPMNTIFNGKAGPLSGSRRQPRVIFLNFRTTMSRRSRDR